jgi:hypothetical protein
MAGARVRYLLDFQNLDVMGHGRASFDGSASVKGSSAVLGAASAPWLRQALRHLARVEDLPQITVELALVSPEHFDEDTSLVDANGLVLVGGDLLLDLTYASDEQPNVSQATALLEPLLRRRRSELTEAYADRRDGVDLLRRLRAPRWGTARRPSPTPRG